MKLFIVLLAFLVACVAGEEWIIKTRNELSEIIDDCVDENPLTLKQLKILMASGVPNGQPPRKHLPNEEAPRQYLLCLYLKMEFFSYDHGIYTERVAKQFQDGLTLRVATKISNYCARKHQNPTVAADVFVYNYYQCYVASVTEEYEKSERAYA